MHYRDGTPAKVGDRCLFDASVPDGQGGWKQGQREALLYAATPGATSCNGEVAYAFLEERVAGDGTVTRLVKMATHFVTIGECDPAD